MDLKDVLVFLLGFVSCAIFVFVFMIGNDLEFPFNTGLAVLDGEDVSAPSDFVDEDDIIVFEDEVILKIEGATLSSYMDSGSMVPVFDEGASGIRIVPSSESEIEIGDIVSYRRGGILIVHRVIEKGIDEEGVYFVAKGDANLVGDGKVRFEDIEYLTVGVIW